MSTLDSYTLHYEDIPKNPNRVGRTFKMSKAKQTTEAPAVYNKSQGEHRKDIVIAILVSAIIAFVGGMYFKGTQQAEIDRAVSAVQPTAQAATEVKK